MDPAEFAKKVNQYFEKGAELKDGYAPFCKHLFVPNFAYLRPSTLKITPENEVLLRTAYESRKPDVRIHAVVVGL